MSFDKVWHSDDQADWNKLLRKYWSLILVDNIQVEYTLNRLTLHDIERMDAAGWYEFLHDDYFVWKYTAKNRLATTRSHLRKYKETGSLDELDEIRRRIVCIDVSDIENSLSVACEVRGLGVAGASGLLSLIYPREFATVDQFVVKALLEVNDEKGNVENMNPENLSISDGGILTNVMREKSAAINIAFDTEFWTPRTLEMALWAYRG